MSAAVDSGSGDSVSDVPMPKAPAPRPLGEWMRAALRDAGLSETDTQTAIEATLPLFVAYLGETASDVEWKYRSMTFYRGGCDSETKLNPAGATVRARAEKLQAWLDGDETSLYVAR